MKKLNYSILIGLLSCFSYVEAQYSVIKTPTNVSVEGQDQSEVSTYWLETWESDAAQWIIDNGLSSYTIKIGPASWTYNCHCYAWNSSDGGVTDWINQTDHYSVPNVSRWWQGTNGTYASVSSLNDATKIFLPIGDHSMIRSSTTPAWYESKWGWWGLYKHTYYAHPFVDGNETPAYFKLDISGNGFTCSSSANIYSTKNISSASYNWSADYLSISGSGYSVTGTGSGNGQGKISVAITSPYSNTTIRGTIPVWVGTPLPSVSGPTQGTVGNSYQYYVNTTPEMMAYSNVHDWSLSPYYDGNSIYDYDYWASAGFYADQEGSFQISATAQNSCGTGYGTTYIWIANYREYLLSPNPASSDVTISVMNPVQTSEKNDGILEVSIYDMQGNLKSQKKYSGDSFTVPVNNLQDGSYLVKIKAGKSIVSKQLIIKH